MDPARRTAALHEGGHAVVAVLEGAALTEIWLGIEAGQVDYQFTNSAGTPLEQTHAEIRIGLAGQILEERLYGKADPEACERDNAVIQGFLDQLQLSPEDGQRLLENLRASVTATLARPEVLRAIEQVGSELEASESRLLAPARAHDIVASIID